MVNKTVPSPKPSQKKECIEPYAGQRSTRTLGMKSEPVAVGLDGEDNTSGVEGLFYTSRRGRKI